MIKAVIFDMDGVLIDSEPLWRRAEREVFAGVGLELDDEDCRRTTGLRADEVVEFWYRRHPWPRPDRRRVRRDLEARVIELIRTEGRPLPGAGAAIERVRHAGLRLALATSSSHAIISAVLTTLGLDDRFEVTASAADEERGKPDPAVYRTAVGRLALAAAACAAVEDSAAGVRAARAAGLLVIAVPAPEELDDPRFDIADLKLASLEQLETSMLE